MANKDKNEIDINLYDRQVRTYGLDATKQINNSNVIIYGLEGGLGIEIIKNIFLSGVKNLYLYDSNPITRNDIQNGIYYDMDDIDQPRNKVLVNKMKELNPYNNLIELNEISDELLMKSTLVLVNCSFEVALKYNEMCRLFNSKMIYLRSSGCSGFIFVDGGNNHRVVDLNDENIDPVQIGIVSENGNVFCANHCTHDFQSGDIINFKNVDGKNIDFLINNDWKIKIKNKKSFQLENFKDSNLVFTNGTAIIKKKVNLFNFNSLNNEMKSRTILGFDTERSNGIINMYKDFDNINSEVWSYERFEILDDYKNIEKLFLSYGVEIHPVVSFIGSVASSEIIKLISNKYTPIKQWWTWDDEYIIPDKKPDDLSDSSIGKLYGKLFESKLNDLKVLMVGCGAIGCEWLKVLSMLNVGINSNIFVTDPDHIEKSNLNRQFLFRSSHIGMSKSLVASKSIIEMNNKMNIIPFENKVSSECTDSNIKLFNERNIIINALDNIKARKFVDELCLQKQLPLFESGTMGMKGNTQPVIPFVTETYGNTSDPEDEKSFPVCTIKNFPNQILHTIHWAKDDFDDFRRIFENLNNFAKSKTFFDNLTTYEKEQAKEDIKSIVLDNSLNSWKDCAILSANKFVEVYVNNILQLLNNFPKDSTNDDGSLFWSKGKRCPEPFNFDINNSNCLDYIESRTHLLSRCCNLDDNFTREDLIEFLKDYKQKEYVIKEDVKFAKDDSELDKEKKNFDVIKLPNDLKIDKEYVPQYFEKDDESNWHIQYITAASNCRAVNYNIQIASFQETKGIAGKIIPAVATTTSAVVGLISLEFLKYCLGRDDIEKYRSWFVNMSDNTSISAEPNPAPKLKFGEKSINSWEKFRFEHNVTLDNFIKYYNSYFDCNINIILYGSSIVYAEFMSTGNNDKLLVNIFKEKYNLKIYENPVNLIIDCEEDYSLPNIEIFINMDNNGINKLEL